MNKKKKKNSVQLKKTCTKLKSINLENFSPNDKQTDLPFDALDTGPENSSGESSTTTALLPDKYSVPNYQKKKKKTKMLYQKKCLSSLT